MTNNARCCRQWAGVSINQSHNLSRGFTEWIGLPCRYVSCWRYRTQPVVRRKATPWWEQLELAYQCNLWCQPLSSRSYFVLSLFEVRGTFLSIRGWTHWRNKGKPPSWKHWEQISSVSWRFSMTTISSNIQVVQVWARHQLILLRDSQDLPNFILCYGESKLWVRCLW